MKKYFFAVIGVLLLSWMMTTAFRTPETADQLNGAWHWQEGSREEVITFADGYFVHTAYDKANKKFVYTWGGPYTMKSNGFDVKVEFHTAEKEKVSQTISIPFNMNNGQLIASVSGREAGWKQLDKGTGELAGAWRITGRMQGSELKAIQRGPRKTLKILSGTRFQWAAINTETKEFFGTGGGTYTLANGKYTEQIEFFSRDSSRVGASLTFDAAVKDGKWMHSGLSSKGDPISEVWEREKEVNKQ